MQTDEELFELCRQRDAQAWGNLVRRYQDRMLNLAYQFTGNREEARDLAQEIFVRLYRTLDRFEAGRPFKVWLYSLARNLCVDHYRRRRRDRWIVDKPVEEHVALASEGEAPDQSLWLRERRESLTQALNVLGAVNREAIVLKDLQDLSLEEMANLLEVPIGTVKSRVHRARIELARVLLKQGRPGLGARDDL